jgi:acyl carrier protein
MESIEKKVRELISEVIKSEEFNVWQISNEDNLFHYGLDSMCAVSLIVLLEDTFSFEFPEEDLNTETIKSIERIVLYVSQKVS